ncbi:MAG TPA: hypothetical protein VLX28_04765 [Thermoanaerobaculia bacterium]|nr:hypothetical protein [Thermoanaerobaculia bacterium]
MSRSCRSRSSFAPPWALILASLLVLVGLMSGACRKEEPPAEQTPAATPAAPEATPAETPTATPAATPGQTFKVTGFVKPDLKWDPQELSVGAGDQIEWWIGNGKHGVHVPNCQALAGTITFDPPLNALCKTKDFTATQPFLKATVKKALDADVPYDCTVHGTNMSGTLKKK